MEDLKKKIIELEQIISEKNKDILIYKKELEKANKSLSETIQVLQNDYQVALRIQKALSPVELPLIQGFDFSTKFVPGNRTGGDYFDIFEHEDKMKFGLLIASSSGHSVSALFLSVLIKLSTQIETRKGLPPHDVLKKMIAEISPEIKGQDQIHIFYAVVDRRTYQMQYSSLGSISGFSVLGSNPYELKSLIQGEPSLRQGVSLNPVSHNLELSPKDRVFWVTEGITGALSEDLTKKSINNLSAVSQKTNEVFGLKGIEQALLRSAPSGVHELRNQIFIEVENESQKSSPIRDQTAVVMEVKDKVIRLAK